MAAREATAFAGLAAQVAPAPVGRIPLFAQDVHEVARARARRRPAVRAEAAAGFRALHPWSDSVAAVQTILVASDAPTAPP